MASTGHNLQGLRHYQSGQYDLALQRFQQALTTDPNDAHAYYNMAATFHKMGISRNDPALMQQAETLYNQCLDLSTDHQECHRGLAVLLVETDRSDRAFALMQNWAKNSPENPQAHIELARLYEEFGDKETAELYVINALRHDPRNWQAYTALAHLYEEKNQPHLALQNYQRSLHLNHMQPQVGNRIASLSRALRGNFESPTLNGGGSRFVNTPPATPRY